MLKTSGDIRNQRFGMRFSLEQQMNVQELNVHSCLLNSDWINLSMP